MASHRLNWACVDVPPRLVIAIRIIAWTTLLAVCRALLVNRSIRSREYRAAGEAHKAEVKRQHEAFLEWVRRDRSREREVKALVRRDHPMDRRPLSHEEVEQILAQLRRTWGEPSRPVLPPAPHTDRFETFRSALVGFYPWQGLGPPAWLLLFILWTFSGPFRRPVSELVLASALICTIFWMADPGFAALTSWSSIFNNDSLFWAALMLVASSVCVYRSYHSRPDESSDRPLSIWRRSLPASR